MSTRADYQPSPVPEYSGNPLIEALPPILSEEVAGRAMGNFPPTPEGERHLSSEVRLHLVNRILSLVQPLPIHLELESTISSLLRSGYVGRNPMLAGTMRHLYGISTGRHSSTNFISTASTTSLTGLSGMGKTTALNSVLSLYPQTIEHHRYQGKEFIHTQIVWLKLECPYDGSLSGLCHAFFRAVDKALGQEDRYASRYRARGGIEEMIQRMNQLASTYFIGALFIDELQHLNRAKVGGKENMLNFFVNLINTIGIPVVFVGTNSMVKLFADVLRNARRASGHGTHYFQQPEPNHPTWEMLVETAWDYQWVRQPVELTPRIKEAIYEYTQGVTDFLAKLLILGQRYAIQAKIETLSPEVFSHVFNTKMRLLKPALEILKSRDPEKMSKFDDLLPPEEILNDMLTLKDRTVSLDMLAGLRRPKPAAAPAQASLPVPSSVEPWLPSAEIVEMRAEQSVAARIATREDTREALIEHGWLASDPLEFSDAYRLANIA